MQEIIENLKKRNETIATMESCTGGGVANEITNYPGASHILKFSAVTYSNEFKIKMGVNKEIIDKYTVYSIEVAREMAKKISEYTGATYGVGVTGKLLRVDESNLHGNDNEVFFSIYNEGKFYDESLLVDKDFRSENKKIIIDKIIEKMGLILNEKNK